MSKEIIAKVKTPFSGCRDGEAVVVKFVKGDIISGDLAAVAIREGWASKARKPRAANVESGGEEGAGDMEPDGENDEPAEGNE